MRRVANPPNPYTAEHCEYLEAPPDAHVEVYEEHARSILSRNDSPDIPFEWSVNPYRGCQHACAYCYARPTHEYLGLGAGTDFDTRISVKVNAPELLRQALTRRGWQRQLIAFSGVTDCYQPLEAVYRVTRRCLETCAELGNPVGIVTKSFLVVRDCDVLQALAERTEVKVLLSVPFADPAAARAIEPYAPSPARRIEAIRRLSAAGVPTGVLVAPLIPGLNDRDIDRVLSAAAQAGARWAAFQALRLPGSVRDVFRERLRAALPDRADRVERRIREMRGGAWNETRFGARMSGQGGYWDGVRTLFRAAARRHGLATGGRAIESARTASATAETAPAMPPPGTRQLPLFGAET